MHGNNTSTSPSAAGQGTPSDQRRQPKFAAASSRSSSSSVAECTGRNQRDHGADSNSQKPATSNSAPEATSLVAESPSSSASMLNCFTSEGTTDTEGLLPSYIAFNSTDQSRLRVAGMIAMSRYIRNPSVEGLCLSTRSNPTELSCAVWWMFPLPYRDSRSIDNVTRLHRKSSWFALTQRSLQRERGHTNFKRKRQGPPRQKPLQPAPMAGPSTPHCFYVRDAPN